MDPWYEHIVGVVVLDRRPKRRPAPKYKIPPFSNIKIPKIRQIFPKMIMKDSINSINENIQKIKSEFDINKYGKVYY